MAQFGHMPNIGWDNDFAYDGTKPLPKPLLTYHEWGSEAFIWSQNHWKF